ncbi:MAG: reverse transcriptase family protein, partial [Bacteroidota bacterium]
MKDAPRLETFQPVNFSMLLKATDFEEVLATINKLGNKTTTGSDGMNNLLAKKMGLVIAPYLVELINSSFKTGIFPEELKVSVVYPLYKNGDPRQPGNYRPISILSTWSKVYERIMNRRLVDYFEKFDLLYSKQFGFRKRHSTVDAIAEFTEKIRHNTSRGPQNTFFLDFKKAFDTIDHNILIEKLNAYGVRGFALKWLKSYLTNRKQYVKIGGSVSSFRDIECGVPQGSVLGPTLFLIYINDLPNVCKHLELFLFADDTNASSLGSTKCEIESDLDNIDKWLLANKLTLNMEKTVMLN